MVTIQNGIVRPQQVQNKEHSITSTHKFVPPMPAGATEAPKPESIEVYRIEIKSMDSRLTDLLTRLISGVLFTNSIGIQNAEENILREAGKWNDEADAPPPADITKDPVRMPRETGAPVNVPGQGDGN